MDHAINLKNVEPKKQCCRSGGGGAVGRNKDPVQKAVMTCSTNYEL